MTMLQRVKRWETIFTVTEYIIHNKSFSDWQNQDEVFKLRRTLTTVLFLIRVSVDL